MQNEATSKSVGGISDLVVWAPIKDGFIDAFENITYETRLRLVGEALHAVRKSAREHEETSPFPDTAERILSLLDFRIGVVEDELLAFSALKVESDAIRPKKFMYLVATFDGPWEPYMRLIWEPLGPFLDLVLCNCEGYVSAVDSSFADYAKWVRANQMEPAIFYSTTGLTVKDQHYLIDHERLQRESDDPDEADNVLARLTSTRPDVVAAKVRKSEPLETGRLALEALTVFYRLADYYPPDRIDGDGRYLLRAAKSLLQDWKISDLPLDAEKLEIIKRNYAAPLKWYETPTPPSNRPSPPDPQLDEAEVQKGLLTEYRIDGAPATDGAIVLMQVTDATKARKFLNSIKVSWEGDGAHASADAMFDAIISNVAFTHHGLETLGLSPALLDAFPKEFRDGMAKRAPVLGDVQGNHPRKWRLPARNWPTSDVVRPPVEIDEVDFMLHFRAIDPAANPNAHKNTSGPNPERKTSESVVYSSGNRSWEESAPNPERLLNEFSDAIENAGDAETAIQQLIELIGAAASIFGVTILSVQKMARILKPSSQSGSPQPGGHFGFRDGISQPRITDEPTAENDVLKGEVLCGYGNMRGDAASSEHAALFQNSSFLAVRKIYQNVSAFSTFKQKYGAAAAHRLVGRTFDGDPLNGAPNNDFNYDDDADGEKIPLASHIRRANPRNKVFERKSPRILRRGMSYEDPNGDDRGLMFMAFNASLAEQYEIVQRWINGGNSTNVASSQVDPFVGIAPRSTPHTFRYLEDGAVKRVVIEEAFTRTDWGAYFFVPSKTALGVICADKVATGIEDEVQRGEAAIKRISTLDATAQRAEWKRTLEDFITKDPRERGVGAAVWAAIRERRGGALRIEAGVAGRTIVESQQKTVVVADERLILDVLSDAETYSVAEQGRRVARSFGAIYVAQDPDETYYREATETNKIIYPYTEEDAFHVAYDSGASVINRMKAGAARLGSDFLKFEIRRQYLMPTLGAACHEWFGIPDGEFVANQGWGWEDADSRTPHCPGDYMAPSRHAFYPRPTAAIEAYGVSHGKNLKTAVDALVADRRKHGGVHGAIAKPMFDAIDDDDLLARNLIGVMTGALPPIDGNLRSVLFEWLAERSLWRHQGAYHRRKSSTRSHYEAAAEALRPPIMEAMSKRPAPDLIYRTATKDSMLGVGGKRTLIKKGDLVILGLVSATQDRLQAGASDDVTIVFGGERSGAKQSPGLPIHACPAQKMAMGAMLGVTAALLDSGRIKALPASLIIEVRDWKKE